MHRGLGSAVHIAHLIIAEVVKEGGAAVDATCGNGHDTLFLARLVGARGKVYAFDIQEKAISTTRSLLEKEGLAQRVQLYQTGHENMGAIVDVPVDAVIFNLGYLPGGDHTIVTRPESTLESVRAALGILRPGGRLVAVAYTGHPGGAQECALVEEEVARLDSRIFRAVEVIFLNRGATAPKVIAVEKAGARGETVEAKENFRNN